ncbi:SIR2 family protein [Rhizobium leguminosarum]|uniref:SIR2 family protein n=1 Tax=Rhizobium leguminosarum TaxID=384 RepID=UPI000FF0696B|nr:SIR2 family protein [Rhizobium leguminosarum]RWY72344.1 SIR2 family protein [Rhizobium leguminosarum]
MPTTIAEILNSDLLAPRLHGIADLMAEKRPSALWVGAGLSARFGNIPTWGHLLETITANAHLNTADHALITTLISNGRTAYAAEYLEDLLQGKFYDQLYKYISAPSGSLPGYMRNWGLEDIVTTNYDCLIEDTFFWYNVVLPSSGMLNLISNTRKIVKLHGTIRDRTTCVASISSYIKNYDNNMDWYLANLFQTRNVIFIGSSMERSEPYFKILRFLKDNGRIPAGGHYCIRAVKDDAEASRLGNLLETFGILLLPYIPDRNAADPSKNHQFIDDALQFIEEKRPKKQLGKKEIDDINVGLKSAQWQPWAFELTECLIVKVIPDDLRKFTQDTVFRLFEMAARAEDAQLEIAFRRAVSFDLLLRLISGNLKFRTAKSLRSLAKTIELSIEKKDVLKIDRQTILAAIVNFNSQRAEWKAKAPSFERVDELAPPGWVQP